MKYIKFTYVDAVTGISIASDPARNGPVFPAIPGLQFIWANESRYPTDVPHLFGTCPDSSNTQFDGVLGVFSQLDFDAMHADELRARIPYAITMRRARRALYGAGLLSTVDSLIAAMTGAAGDIARIDWATSSTVERNWPLVISLGPTLGLSEAQLDALFIAAAKL